MTDGELRWEPGSLPTHEVERILTDALADLWRDSYRRSPGADESGGVRYTIFRRHVELALYSATGYELWLTRKFSERG